MLLVVADDFTDAPGGRYRKDGKHSGQEFRDDLLIPRYIEAINAGEPLIVVLDHVYGYSSSFLEESFGGLVRKGFDCLSLKLVCVEDGLLVNKIIAYIKEAKEKKWRE